MKNKSTLRNFSGCSCHTPDDFNVCYPKKKVPIDWKEFNPKVLMVNADVQFLPLTFVFTYVERVIIIIGFLLKLLLPV